MDVSVLTVVMTMVKMVMLMMVVMMQRIMIKMMVVLDECVHMGSQHLSPLGSPRIASAPVSRALTLPLGALSGGALPISPTAPATHSLWPLSSSHMGILATHTEHIPASMLVHVSCLMPGHCSPRPRVTPDPRVPL